MTETDHLSPMRASISRAWQFAGVYSSSAGRLGGVFAIGYSEVSGAPFCAFFCAREGPVACGRLRIVTTNTGGRGGNMVATAGIDLQTVSIGLFIIRVVVGLLMAAHGAQKLLGW